MHLRLYNEKSNVTRKEMHTFMGKRYLNVLEMHILDTLYLLKILNRHVLQQYIWNKYPEYAGKDFKNVLKKMVELGVLLRYSYEYVEDGEQKQTPYFYALSYGSYQYLRKVTKHSEAMEDDYEEVNVDTAYKILSINQFYVFFLKEYEGLLKRDILHHSVAYGENNKLTIDLSLRLKVKKLTCGFLDIVVVPVRKNSDWEQILIEKIEAYMEYLDCKNSLITSPVFLFLAESDEHVKDIYMFLKDSKIDFKDTIRLYTTDLQTAREPILNYLYDCEEKENTVSLVVKNINL